MGKSGWMGARWGRYVRCVVAGLSVGLVTGAAQGQTVVIGNDRGGLIGARVIEVAQLNAQNRRVELRGRVCYSSCTLYLGADDLCISPHTTFGFHGPSRNGRPLQDRQFEHWSNVMARHYTPPLRDWFLRDARHQIGRIRRVSGARLIAMGYPPC